MIFETVCGREIAAHETKDNSFLEALGLQTHGQRDQLKVRDPQQKLIVIATGQVGSSAFASFARTCEVRSLHALCHSLSLPIRKIEVFDLRVLCKN